MDVRSMVTLPVHVALMPACIAVHVLFAMGNRWMSTPTPPPIDMTPPPIDISPDYLNGAEHCRRCAWYD